MTSNRRRATPRQHRISPPSTNASPGSSAPRARRRTEIAQENAKPVDDVALRRIVAASLLDVLVRIGDPYPAALTAAKSLAPNPDALKPLDAFAASGVPSPPVLSRELLALVPKLSPPPPEIPPPAPAWSTGCRRARQNSFASSAPTRSATTSGNVVARVTAAALRNDYKEARRELETLPPPTAPPRKPGSKKPMRATRRSRYPVNSRPRP